MVAGRTTEPRSVTLTTTSGQAGVTAASGTFNAEDVNRVVTATGIPAGTTLSAVASDTAATLSANATASGSRSVVIGTEGGLAPTNYGFRGWSPESETESQAYSVSANNAGTPVPPAKLTDGITRTSQRSRG